jgi:hypothetical protein
MIRLQMVENKVIDIGKFQPNGGKGFFELFRRPGPVPDQVNKGSFFAPYNIRVEGNPVRDGPNPLKKIRSVYISVKTINVFGNEVGFHSILFSNVLSF